VQELKINIVFVQDASKNELSVIFLRLTMDASLVQLLLFHTCVISEVKTQEKLRKFASLTIGHSRDDVAATLRW
jgi:hypothetical protein